ncbi:MAG TPA: histidine phosphatase family protein [Terriglobales bacterium]|nr:histidine phosphatase family protein [Terriglobales bacterium]
MSRVVIVRHGETVWHAENRYAGLTEIALTDKGLSQAEQLAGWAAKAALSSIWSSPLKRAVVTAQPSCESTGLKLQIDDRLKELDFGRGEGLTASDMKQQFPAEYAAFRQDPVAHHLPGGEDPVAAAERTVSALYEIAASGHADARHLVVAHNTVLRLAVCKLLGIPLHLYRERFPLLQNGAITELIIDNSSVSLLSFNVPITTVPR